MTILPSDWPRHFVTSHLLQLKEFWQYFERSKYSTSSSFVFFRPICLQRRPLCLWLAKTVWTFPLQLLNGFWWSMIENKYYWENILYQNLYFFGLMCQQRWPQLSLISYEIFHFSFATTALNGFREYITGRKCSIDILYYLCILVDGCCGTQKQDSRPFGAPCFLFEIKIESLTKFFKYMYTQIQQSWSFYLLKTKFCTNVTVIILTENLWFESFSNTISIYDNFDFLCVFHWYTIITHVFCITKYNIKSLLTSSFSHHCYYKINRCGPVCVNMWAAMVFHEKLMFMSPVIDLIECKYQLSVVTIWHKQKGQNTDTHQNNSCISLS